MSSFKTVDEYIKNAPKELQPKLQELREIIKSIVPTAQERISYGMPYYDYQGRLVYFAGAKEHIGMYIPTPIIDQFKDELKGYHANKATIHFPLDKKFPKGLITKLIKARMKLNEERMRQK